MSDTANRNLEIQAASWIRTTDLLEEVDLTVLGYYSPKPLLTQLLHHYDTLLQNLCRDTT